MEFETEKREEREKRVREIMKRLEEHYREVPMSFLEASTPWQLLFATILSAQCTDARVNKVTDLLYRKYRSVQDFADCDLRELERDIHSIGFYHSKARNLKACAAVLLEKYGGRVPDQLEELTALPGVGRKTANLILGRVYGKPSIVVDTHVRRVSNRLGLAKSSDPLKTELQLQDSIPREFWTRWNTRVMALGRTRCSSLKPKCESCYLKDLCPSRDGDPGYWRAARKKPGS